MLEWLLYIILIIMILNFFFSFLAIDNRIVGIILLLVVLGFFFGGPRRGMRGFCANDLPPAPSLIVGAAV